MSHFQISVKVPLRSDSFSDQAEAVAKLSAAIGAFRKALSALAPEHEYHDEVVKERKVGPRRGRKPKGVEPVAAEPLPQAAE